MVSTKEQLLSIMDKYDIGKKPLSRLLGWGDTTILRYLDGIEPNREFAERIRELWENPWIYAELLERGKERLTKTAYQKTKRAVHRQMFFDKSTEAMQYIISLADGDIAPFRVVAVLYHAQVLSLLCHGLPVFEEEVCIELKQEVQYPRLYGELIQYGVKCFLPEEEGLSDRDREFLSMAYQVLNGYSPNAVRAIWRKEKRQLRRRYKQEEILGSEQLLQHYEAVVQKLPTQGKFDLKEYLNWCLSGKGK